RAITELRERRDDGFAQVLVVLDDENRLVTARRDFRHDRILALRLRFARARQQKLHRRAASHLAFDRRNAARLLRETVHHREPEPTAFARFFRREERFEHALQDLGLDAAAGVGHADRHVLSGLELRVSRTEGAVEHDVLRTYGETPAL